MDFRAFPLGSPADNSGAKPTKWGLSSNWESISIADGFFFWVALHLSQDFETTFNESCKREILKHSLF